MFLWDMKPPKHTSEAHLGGLIQLYCTHWSTYELTKHDDRNNNQKKKGGEGKGKGENN